MTIAFALSCALFFALTGLCGRRAYLTALALKHASEQRAECFACKHSVQGGSLCHTREEQTAMADEWERRLVRCREIATAPLWRWSP